MNQALTSQTDHMHWSGYPTAIIDLLTDDNRTELEQLGELSDTTSKNYFEHVAEIINRDAMQEADAFDRRTS